MDSFLRAFVRSEAQTVSFRVGLSISLSTLSEPLKLKVKQKKIVTTIKQLNLPLSDEHRILDRRTRTSNLTWHIYGDHQAGNE